ncbi:uncharacterized protein LOC143855130 isoform X2 [Tasmannia lanceolata]|uniref:uncharacterized protein LOC143855130 isoform X2 n=1 Tax=Tasmannia lanceolata TaxID=3420 RepID=UPI0040645F88
MGDKLPGSTAAAPKKTRFAPKIPPRKNPKPEIKTEASQVEDNSEWLKLVKKQEVSGARGPKVDKKSPPAQVAFGYGGSSSYPRSFGIPRGPSSSSSNGIKDQDDATVLATQEGHDMEKEYVEPWDYYSYYPVTLPLRRPHSEVLDEMEFGEASANLCQDKTYINAAAELELMEEKEEEQLLFFQLPASLPLVKRSASAKGKEIADGSNSSQGVGISEKGCSLEELPAGHIGKMLVYKSGAVKMKLGDTLFNVSPGLDCIFAQDVAAINLEDKHCCVVGELNKRAIVTPDVFSVLDCINDVSLA